MTGLFVNNLTVIDFSYVDATRGLVGESYIVDVELYGELDPQGMIFDFGSVKKQLKQDIETLCDHKLWLPLLMPGLQVSVQEDNCHATWTTHSGDTFDYLSPKHAVFTLESEHVEPELIRPVLEQHLLKNCPSNIQQVKLRIRTEAIEGDYYHYSHGLKKHLGDCQRIAHGHRSQIQIYVNGDRNEPLEKHWCNTFSDSYLATEEDLQGETESNYRFSYQSQQGYFEISVPKRIVTLMGKETTVENIAEFIAKQTASQQPGNIIVRAYEGVEKGAIYQVIS